MGDMILLFTKIKLLDFIQYPFFITAQSLGCEPTTSLVFHHLTPQTSPLADAAILCEMSEYAAGNKTLGMVSQDDYGD